jgi:hypothetical protein
MVEKLLTEISTATWVPLEWNRFLLEKGNASILGSVITDERCLVSQ